MSATEAVILAHVLGLAALLGYAASLVRGLNRAGGRRRDDER